MSTQPKEAHNILDSIFEASKLYLKENLRLITIIQMNINLPIPSIGRFTIELNEKEALSKLNKK